MQAPLGYVMMTPADAANVYREVKIGARVDGTKAYRADARFRGYSQGESLAREKQQRMYVLKVYPQLHPLASGKCSQPAWSLSGTVIFHDVNPARRFTCRHLCAALRTLLLSISPVLRTWQPFPGVDWLSG